MTQAEEIRAIDQLAGRLRERFPGAPADAIKNMVNQVHRQYDGSPVRDFIPVLVEREVVEYLRTPKHRLRAG
jgi:hypothetical protein